VALIDLVVLVFLVALVCLVALVGLVSHGVQGMLSDYWVFLGRFVSG
jgi:hypothetical protein